MCIRDRVHPVEFFSPADHAGIQWKNTRRIPARTSGDFILCLLYTSDAADERSSVDLGGRRIIKKKTQLTMSIRY